MKRTLAFLAAVTLTAAFATTPAGAQGDEADQLGGFTLEARANLFNFVYDSPNLMPISPLFQTGVPETVSTLSSGPVGTALSSLVWPGVLLADFQPLLEQAGGDQIPFKVPSYPVRAQVNSSGDDGGEQRTEVAPGAVMLAAAKGNHASAAAQFLGLNIDELYSVGGAKTNTVTEVVDGVAVSTARSELNDVSLLGGIIRIDSVVSEVTTRSDGVTSSYDYVSEATNASVLGLDAVIDKDGIRVVEDPPPPPAQGSVADAIDPVLGQLGLGGAADALDQVLGSLNPVIAQVVDAIEQGSDALAEQTGISITLAEPTIVQNGALAEVSQPGLQVDLYYDGENTPVTGPLFEQLAAALPTDPLIPGLPLNTSPQALVDLLTRVHVFTFNVGTTFATANATEAFVFELPPLPSFGGFTSGGTGSLPAPVVADTSFVAPSTGSVVSGGPAPQPAPTITPVTAAFTPGKALPGIAVLVVAVAMVMFGRLSKQLSDWALSP